MSSPPDWATQRAIAIVRALVDSLGAEGVDIDAEDLRTYSAQEGCDIEGMMVRLVRAARSAKGDVKKQRDWIAELNARKARYESRRERLRRAIITMMDSLPEVFPNRKLTHAEFTVSFRDGQAKEIVTDVDELPDDCVSFVRVADMTAILAKLARNEDVPGVTVSNAEPVLTIR